MCCLPVPSSQRPAPASCCSEALRGTWEHEQRLIQSARGEERAMAAARELRHQLRRWAMGRCLLMACIGRKASLI